MHIQQYITHRISECEIEFFSEGSAGSFPMRIRFTFIDPARELYNLGFGLWSPSANLLDDKAELRNGDMDRILATVGQQAIAFLDKNPSASIAAAGSILPDKPAIRTRKYQMGINSNYEMLSERHNIYGFIAEKFNGDFVGYWPRWKGRWEVFDRRTNYDAFLLNLR
jgi:hypothetical protein